MATTPRLRVHRGRRPIARPAEPTTPDPLPRGVYREGYEFGATRTLICVADGRIVRRCTVEADHVRPDLAAELLAWLDREYPIASRTLALV